MNIHQLSVTYHAEQDRILLRVNTTAGEEMRLWFTRRLMLGLWPMLNRALSEHLLRTESAASSLEQADAGLRQMLTEFRMDEFVQHADFDTPYQDQAALPLGPEPLLVTDVEAKPLENGQLQLNFNEQPAGAEGPPRSFQIQMESRLMQGLMHLLNQAVAQSRWREPLEAVPREEGTPAGDGPAQRPRYLN
jgi:hypothetical protein